MKDRTPMAPRTAPGVSLALGLLPALLGIAGCQQPAQPTHDTAALLSVADEADYDRLWDTTTTVLRRYNFVPDRQDRVAGVITTNSTVSAQWFEFWRQDVVTAYDFAASNLATYRKSARVQIDATGDPNEYVLAVRVNVERMTSPERQVNAAAGSYQMFGTHLPTTEGDLLKGKVVERWIPKGRDGKLEDVILSRIIDRFHPESYEFIEYVTDDAKADSDVPVMETAPVRRPPATPANPVTVQPAAPATPPTVQPAAPPSRRPATTGPIQQVQVKEVR